MSNKRIQKKGWSIGDNTKTRKIQYKYNKYNTNTIKIQYKYNTKTIKIQMQYKHNKNTIQIQSKYNRNTIEIQTKTNIIQI